MNLVNAPIVWYIQKMLQKNQSGHDFSLYRCVSCTGALPPQGLTNIDGPGIQCPQCQTFFPIKQNVLDTLVNPSEETIREIKGMARERGMPLEDWSHLKIRPVEN